MGVTGRGGYSRAGVGEAVVVSVVWFVFFMSVLHPDFVYSIADTIS